MGFMTAFDFGEGYELWKGMATANGLIVSEVYPQARKKSQCVSAAKGTSLLKASPLWPTRRSGSRRTTQPS